MAVLTTDRLRLVQFAQGGRIALVRDLLDGVTYKHVRDSFKITAPPKQRLLTSPSRRFGGQRVGNELWENGSLAAQWVVNGPTAGAAMTNASLLLQSMEDLTPDQYLEWRPTGLAQSTYFELRGSADWQPEYSWLEWSAGFYLKVTGRFSFAPLGLGDPMAILDTFLIDSVASGEWSQVVAEGATAVVVGNGAVSGSGGLAQRKVLLALGRNYDYQDARVVVRFTTGNSIATGLIAGAQLCNQSSTVAANGASNPGVLEGYVTDDGTNSRLKIDVYLAGALTNLYNATVTRLVANTTYWVVFRRQGSIVEAELWTTPPTPNQVPTVTSGPIKLTAAQRLAAGKAGFVFVPINSVFAVTDVAIEPYHYRYTTTGTMRQLPQVISLPALPGDAPPRCDVDVGVFAGSQPVFGMLAAWPKPSTWNRITNGDYTYDPVGVGIPANWGASALASFPIVAPTTVTVVQDPVVSPPVRSRNVVEIATPASANAGVYFDGLVLEPGKTYYAEAWVRAATATGNVELAWGFPASAAIATSAAAVALASTWQKVTLAIDTTTSSLTPIPGQTNGRTILAVRQKGSVAQTFQIAGVSLYESAALPAGLLDTQVDGRGAAPPLGILDIEQSISRPTSTDATGRMGSTWQTGAGNLSAAIEWMIDPALCRPDDFSAGEIDIEVWAHWFYAATSANLVFTLSVQPDSGSGNGTPRYTAEWGSTGYTPVLPTGDAWRFSRLGTLRLRCSTVSPARQRLRFAYTASINAGIKLDHLICVPLRRRAASPTGRANDTAYPALMPSTWSGTSDVTKTILQEGGGLITAPGPGLERRDGPWPEHGLGFPLTLDPGVALEVLCKLSTLVPDDPTALATSEQLNHAGHVAFPIIPRYLLARAT